MTIPAAPAAEVRAAAAEPGAASPLPPSAPSAHSISLERIFSEVVQED